MKYLIFLVLLISSKIGYSQDTSRNTVIVILKDSSVRLAIETVVHMPSNCGCIGYFHVVKYNYPNGELITNNPQHDGKIVNVFDYFFKNPEDIWHHP